jgi:hypothetical protein
MYIGTMKSIEEVEAFMKPIWRAERGRYGHAKRPVPNIRSGRGASAHGSGLIVLGRWARNPWVVLHEMTHCLTPEAHHGPRFVGVLIGLTARHIGLDADAMLQAAYDMGVKVDVRSIGRVPVYPWWKRVEKCLPGTDMEIAIELGVSFRVVRGAALHLIRLGKARWKGRKLVAIPLANSK